MKCCCLQVKNVVIVTHIRGVKNFLCVKRLTWNVITILCVLISAPRTLLRRRTQRLTAQSDAMPRSALRTFGGRCTKVLTLLYWSFYAYR
jgi:hypothetical protein